MDTPSQTSFEKERGVTGVLVRDGLTLVTCTAVEQRLGVLTALAKEGIPVFHLKLHENSFTYIVRTTYAERVLETSTQSNAATQIETGVAFVSVVAGAMRDLSGIIARIYDALVGKGVRILQTGDAHDSVHCLVRESSIEAAVAALKAEFDLPAGELS